MKTEQDLLQCAYEVADQYKDGLWPEWRNKQWQETRKLLINVLRHRCPGFTDTQYGEALNRGFLDER